VEERVGDGLKTDIKHLHFVVPGLEESDFDAMFTGLSVTHGHLVLEHVVVLLSKAIVVQSVPGGDGRNSIKD